MRAERAAAEEERKKKAAEVKAKNEAYTKEEEENQARQLTAMVRDSRSPMSPAILLAPLDSCQLIGASWVCQDADEQQKFEADVAELSKDGADTSWLDKLSDQVKNLCGIEDLLDGQSIERFWHQRAPPTSLLKHPMLIHLSAPSFKRGVLAELCPALASSAMPRLWGLPSEPSARGAFHSLD